MDFLHLYQTKQQQSQDYQGSKYKEPWVDFERQTKTVSYNKDYSEYYNEYLTFDVKKAGEIKFKYQSDTYLSKSIYYSTDKENWTNVISSSVGTSLGTFNVGDKIYIKGTETKYASTFDDGNTFVCEAEVEVSGNIMSLIYGDNFKENTEIHEFYTFCNLFASPNIISAENLILPSKQLVPYCYAQMFRSCTSLVSAPKLPSTKLADGCYQEMFAHCPLLKVMPNLPATTLMPDCYKSMFSDCASLIKTSKLPADILVRGCYVNMFNGCSNLKFIKALFTTSPDVSYTENWVNNVSPTGTFIKADEALWEVIGPNGIPTGWITLKNSEYGIQYELPKATTSVLGGMKIPTSGAYHTNFDGFETKGYNGLGVDENHMLHLQMDSNSFTITTGGSQVSLKTAPSVYNSTTIAGIDAQTMHQINKFIGPSIYIKVSGGQLQVETLNASIGEQYFYNLFQDWEDTIASEGVKCKIDMSGATLQGYPDSYPRTFEGYLFKDNDTIYMICNELSILKGSVVKAVLTPSSQDASISNFKIIGL